MARPGWLRRSLSQDYSMDGTAKIITWHQERLFCAFSRGWWVSAVVLIYHASDVGISRYQHGYIKVVAISHARKMPYTSEGSCQQSWNSIGQPRRWIAVCLRVCLCMTLFGRWFFGGYWRCLSKRSHGDPLLLDWWAEARWGWSKFPLLWCVKR